VIEINISGKWPDLKQTAKVEPMAWLNEFFGLGFKAGSRKYTIDELWS
jgi:hypothetical protein